MNKAYSWLPLSILVACLALLAACGGDDDSDTTVTPTATGDASASPGTDAATTTATGAPVSTQTPRPLTGRDCVPGENPDDGLISYMEFGEGSPFFEPGANVDITLVLKNCAGQAVELHYENEARYDFVVDDPTGQEIWRWTELQQFAEVPGQVTIEPGEVVQYTETWNQQNLEGDDMPPGIYKVYAFSLGCARPDASNCHFGPVELIEITES